MSRGVGLTEWLTTLPDPIIILFALLTQLADFWFVFLAVAGLYWLGPQTPWLGEGVTRQRAGMVVALLALAVALTVSLKVLFGLPRPDGAAMASEAQSLPAGLRALYVTMATGEGYGFPSGHATVAVLVWGGLAWAVRTGTRRARTTVAAVVVGLVLLSRLVLGVHYAVDVVVGAAIAGSALWLSLAALRTPERVFGLAAVVALVGLAGGGLSRDVGAAVGMGLVGTAVWPALPEIQTPAEHAGVVTLALGVLTVGVLVAAALLLISDGLTVALVAGVGTALLLALPLAGDAVAKKV